MYIYLVIFLLPLVSSDIPTVSSNICNEVNKLRQTNGKIPFNISLAAGFTAAVHHQNLLIGWQDPFNFTCNPHSWFDDPRFNITYCCYGTGGPGFYSYNQCMSDKARRITANWPNPYPGLVMENIYYQSGGGWNPFGPPVDVGRISPAALVNSWANSPGHLSAMLSSYKVCGGYAGSSWGILMIGNSADNSTEIPAFAYNLLGNPDILPITSVETSRPSFLPSFRPSIQPSFFPTSMPTIYPTFFPTIMPTFRPSFQPTFRPTFRPSISPTFRQSFLPTFQSTVTSSMPSHRSLSPSILVTLPPTLSPTISPTNSPIINPPAESRREDTALQYSGYNLLAAGIAAFVAGVLVSLIAFAVYKKLTSVPPPITSRNITLDGPSHQSFYDIIYSMDKDFPKPKHHHRKTSSIV